MQCPGDVRFAVWCDNLIVSFAVIIIYLIIWFLHKVSELIFYNI